MRKRSSAALAWLALAAAPGLAAAQGTALYATHCAECHGADRLGGKGPALLPENLGRLPRKDAAQVIAAGRPATQMPAFAPALSGADIEALVALAYSPLAAVPRWDMAAMQASRVLAPLEPADATVPAHGADPLNLFVVVETGDQHVTILDGDRFAPIHRFESRYALHGGPKFSPDGRFVYLMSRDGWVSKFDLHRLRLVAEVRAGINSRNIAISGDGRSLAVANYLPHTLVILDAGDLAPIKVIPAADRQGKATSRVSAVYQAARRESFIVALKDLAEVWEVFYGARPPPVYEGLVHNYQPGMVEGVAQKGPFPVRRIALEQPLDDFFFDADYRHLVGSGRDGGSRGDGGKTVVVNLDVGRPIATLDLPGLPHLGSGITFLHDGKPVMATPHMKEGAVSVIDTKTWRVIKRIETPGPGFFLRGHENSPYIWVDSFLSPAKDSLHVIDTRTLELVRTLRPDPGRTAAHVEFTRDGRYALASIWEQDGAVVVYDAASFEIVKRIAMRKPSGKYNVHNKIRLSPGTSH
jgi:mono/diheme cytochrome c family protein/DNA-binding beta-propeller fold protein YncE